MSNTKREYFPALDGLRGYGFLIVFLVHYNYNNVYRRPSGLAEYPHFLLTNTLWFALPAFFTLSGFLITRILVNTREREGYFRVFYFRRVVRVFPMYYMVVIAIALLALFRHWEMHPSHLLYLVYLQNFSDTATHMSSNLSISHLWSLAVEEQFYFVWPLIIWLFPSEKMLLRVSYGVIAACFLLRFSWPLLHVPFGLANGNTFTRVDSIILGAVLAIHHKRGVHWNALVKSSRILIPVVWLTLAAVALVRGTGLANDYFGVAISIPAMNLIGAGFVVLALQPATLVYKACSGALIRYIGHLSYSLYLFHQVYMFLFTRLLTPKLERFLPHMLSVITMEVAALALTILLATITYRFIETPAMRWKDKLSYGPRTTRDPVLVEVPSQSGLQGMGAVLETN